MATRWGLGSEMIDIPRRTPTPINLHPQRCELCRHWLLPVSSTHRRCEVKTRLVEHSHRPAESYHVATLAEDGVGCELFVRREE